MSWRQVPPLIRALRRIGWPDAAEIHDWGVMDGTGPMLPDKAPDKAARADGAGHPPRSLPADQSPGRIKTFG